jgi:hypothetical protein
MRIFPNHKNEYPLFIAMYWIILWIAGSVLIYYLVHVQTVSGYIEKRDCITTKQKECVLYSRLYKIPVEQEVGIQIVGVGIIIGLIVMVGGYGRMLTSKE